MKILLDTNVLISAFVFGGKAGQLLEKLFDSDFELLVSDYVDREFHDKLNEKVAQQGIKGLHFVSNVAIFVLFKFRYNRRTSARSKRQPRVKRRHDAQSRCNTYGRPGFSRSKSRLPPNFFARNDA